MKVSILIINYNYDRYLSESIECCLNQSYNDIEVIVVDDGSTDNSRKVIENYSNSIKAIYQDNSGMMEAVNRGFAASNGDIIIILDADDFLYPNTVSRIVQEWRSGISKIHYRLHRVDADGNIIGQTPNVDKKLNQGEVWKLIAEKGSYNTPPTSGNAFSRKVFERFFPVKDAKIANTGSYFDRIPTDAYLKKRIPFFGRVVAIDEPLAAYRIHSQNSGANSSPYINCKKRHRLLTLARMDHEFISAKAKEMGFDWSQDILFKKNKMLALRILSYRFDKHHPFAKDNVSLIVALIFKNFKEKERVLKNRLYYLFINLFLLLMPNLLVKLFISLKFNSAPLKDHKSKKQLSPA